MLGLGLAADFGYLIYGLSDTEYLLQSLRRGPMILLQPKYAGGCNVATHVIIGATFKVWSLPASATPLPCLI